ncbi:oxidoreductase [Paracoccus sediminis]|uniref:Malate/lactate/ureidoglycolate dehydrogenase, LDH2 family n=1 Tax=Paracoccus sediminis TaxID=1214787 RepID=A0A238VJ22_9RHOB|nr:Ldh family oxidoreductase [Paracoccus sediminis]TBN52083.1 oxidoreductase [Paracoccus sediminis]SNR33509.1 Malate/lactate/ureidoglycolate dehydrogenase, LDH2 family [Paracoccus sediminis]
MDQARTLMPSEIRDLVVSVLAANGLGDEAAQAVADVVARAEADDCRSHGLYRVEGYVAALRSGRVNPAAQPCLHRLKPALVRVDGDRGFAPHAADIARPHLVAAARANGIAALAITNTHHFSALWADLERLAEAGLVAWGFVVGQCAVAPHGGTAPLMGTNPIAFCWPRPDGLPFVFDLATSAAARGEVELRRLAGETLPEGWAIDAQGAPTADPGAALSGALLLFGGHKGSALSMMVELIAGPLIGEMTSRQVAALGQDDGGPPPGGQLILAVDPSSVSSGALRAGEGFFADAAAQPGLRLPSDRRYAARARSAATGVRVPCVLLDRIRALRSA